MRLLQLQNEVLIPKHYKPCVIKLITREDALKKVKKVESDNKRIVVPFDYNPRIKSPGSVMKKHHKAMLRKNPLLKEVFPGDPMAGLRQGKNLKRILCRDRLSAKPTTRPVRASRTTPGWRRCSSHNPGSRQCPACPYTMGPTSEIIGQVTNYKHTIKDNLDCQSKNCIYYWKCVKPNCPDYPHNEYIGKSTQSFQAHICQHRDYVKRGMNTEPSGEHFNLTPGHNVSHLQGLALEQVKSGDPFILKTREHLLISKFNSFRCGLNKQR